MITNHEITYVKIVNPETKTIEVTATVLIRCRIRSEPLKEQIGERTEESWATALQAAVQIELRNYCHEL